MTTNPDATGDGALTHHERPAGEHGLDQPGRVLAVADRGFQDHARGHGAVMACPVRHERLAAALRHKTENGEMPGHLPSSVALAAEYA
jgi:hypothetical protein